jgi:hypothetical protein
LSLHHISREATPDQDQNQKKPARLELKKAKNRLCNHSIFFFFETLRLQYLKGHQSVQSLNCLKSGIGVLLGVYLKT